MSPQPAAFTRMSTRGYFLSTSAAAARIDSDLAMSMATKSILPLAASFFSASPAAALTSAQITVAPARAKAITVALPMPEAPPVTSAVLPSNFIVPLPLVLCFEGSAAPARNAVTRWRVSGLDSSRRVNSNSSVKPPVPGRWAAAMQALLAASAAAGRPAMRRAVSVARCASSARGTAQCTTPRPAAAAPSRISAPRMSREASAGPHSRVSRCVPPAPGIKPSRTSGRPILASFAAMRRSQASASSKPPPIAAPPISASVTCGSASMRE